MPEDERAVTVSEFKDFREELRRTLNTIGDSIKLLEKGQTDLALQIADDRRKVAEKALEAQKELLTARSAESERFARLDVKTGIIWAIGGALLIMAGNALLATFRASGK